MEKFFELESIADLHNRRSNVNVTSTWFKERDIPYLAWKEDKLLLKISDLPILINVEPRASRNWTRSFRASQRQEIISDQQLRRLIDTDCLYAVTGIRDSLSRAGDIVYLVTEYRFVND